jgi:transcriptional regulator with GAF, ATPase, and Fis domain
VEDYATVVNPGPDQAERTFERIIGNSAAPESVFEQVEQVAPTDSTVPIEGKPAREKNSLPMPFTMPVSVAGALL